jgi:hypothetical protein
VLVAIEAFLYQVIASDSVATIGKQVDNGCGYVKPLCKWFCMPMIATPPFAPSLPPRLAMTQWRIQNFS